MLSGSKRLREWIGVLRWAHGRQVSIPWSKMLVAILSGPVPRSVWRSRIRTCWKCPLFRRELVDPKRRLFIRACSSTHPDFVGLGCQCNTTMLALWAEPYPRGCIARFWGEMEMGWGAYRFPTRWRRFWAPVRFLLGR